MAGTVSVIGHRYLWIDEKVREEQRAADLFRHIRNQALLKRLWSALTGRSGRLLPLASVEATCTVVECCDAGTRTVPIDRIRGSSNRCCDFDAGFRPLHSHDQARWLRVAAARLRGAKLPPVELIELAGIYFVVDGHHRISVARALGEAEIRARVTTWQVAGPLA
jgi:hypothetical protein